MANFMEGFVISLRKIFFICFLTLLIFFGYFFIASLDNKTKLIFCDVGQGDASYLRIKNKIDVLIDAGPNQQVLSCLGKYMPFWDRKIELVILSHPNIDHYGGFFYVLNRYQLGQFITVKTPFITKSYQQLLDKINNKKIVIKYKTRGNKLQLVGDIILFFWPPTDFISGQDNDYSSIFLFQEDSFKVLFTGDASLLVLNSLLNQSIQNVTILKIPHHGSKNGLTEKFLQLANPKTAVISVGKNNSYGHPHKEILDMLEAKKIKIKRTDLEGDILFKF